MLVSGSRDVWNALGLEFENALTAYKGARDAHEKAEATHNTARELCAAAAYAKGFAKGYTKGYATGSVCSLPDSLHKRRRLNEQSWEEKVELAEPALMEEFDVDDWQKQWKDADGRWCSSEGPQEPGPPEDSSTEAEKIEPTSRYRRPLSPPPSTNHHHPISGCEA